MDVTFSNMLEGTRQYFMGLPKAQPGGGGGGGAPGAWAGPRVEDTASAPQPARPPSEPLEPEPHIIHKATVMREAAEKRRERPDPDDEDDPAGALSPPSHIIHRPRAPPASPAPAPAAPSPSPARPPSAAPPAPGDRHAACDPAPSLSAQPPPPHEASPYRPQAHRVQTPTSRPPDHFAPGRPPDPYSASRPPEPYARYHYEASLSDGGRSSRGPLVESPQPSVPPRHSPQTYARLSSAMPQHGARLRDSAAPGPPAQRYGAAPGVPPPPHNDRVPPIHHPHAPTTQRVPSVDGRSSQYAPLPQHREPSPYSRASTHYDRHPVLPQRKYDPQQAYPGYRPTPTAPQSVSSHRVEPLHQIQYKIASSDPVSSHYNTARPLDRASAPPSQSYPHDVLRHPYEGHAPAARKVDYPNMSRPVEARSSYHYPVPSTSAVRYAPNPSAAVPVPVVPSSTVPAKPVHRSATAPRSNYEFTTSSPVQTSPARSTVKPGYPNQQARMTVSVTTLVNQMNQTKQKRESPLDLSVKTVKNSADSSTTQDDLVDSATPSESKTLSLLPRPTSSGSRHAAAIESHKVDFAPDFTQYRERSSSLSYSMPAQPSQHPVRYNGGYEPPRPAAEAFPLESRHQVCPDRSKYTVSTGRTDYVPQIDLTRAIAERRPENRIRDDRNFRIEERKRSVGSIVSNIPEKMVRYETWTADSRISDRMTQSAREQRDLMSRPVFSYSSHKQFEAYQNEQKRAVPPTPYQEHHSHANHRYPPYSADVAIRERSEYHAHYHERNPSSSSRHIIQKIPSHREVHPHHVDPHGGIPADKRVLSILRNSLETKQTGHVEPAKPARQIPDLIVIDDVDDSVIEITDLTKENDVASTVKARKLSQTGQILGHHIQMPKAVDSIPRDSDYQKLENPDPKSRSPENDVSSRIRTKGELKVLPPSHDNMRPEIRQYLNSDHERIRMLPKSQKQHLFNQIREDLRLESVIKNDKCPAPEHKIPEVKSEPMNIEEIEKDAQLPIKSESTLENIQTESRSSTSAPEDDLDWASACDSFMEQLKSGCLKKKSHRKRTDTVDRDSESKIIKTPKAEPTETSSPEDKEICTPSTETETVIVDLSAVVIKQEPVDNDEINNTTTQESPIKENNKPEVKEYLHDHDITEEEIVDSQKLSILKETEVEKDTDKMNKPPIGKQPDEKDEEEATTKKSSQTTETIEKRQVKTKKSPTAKGTSDKRKDLINKKRISLPEIKGKGEKKIKKSSLVKESNDKVKRKKSVSQEEPTEKDKHKPTIKKEKNKFTKRKLKDKTGKDNSVAKTTIKVEKTESKISTTTSSATSANLETKQIEPIKTVIKEELESTDDDEPLIKSKLLKEKEIKYQLLKDLSEKSAYVKLECFDVDLNKNTRISIDSLTKDKDEKQSKGKSPRQTPRTKGKSLSTDKTKADTKIIDSTTDSEDDELSVASRLRIRKNIKTEDNKLAPTNNKTSVKASPSKKHDSSSISNCSTPLRKPGFGDGSDFHPGWEEELYRYKRSLRMPTRLIAIPRGRSGGPFVRGSGGLFTRGSTSLPDLDPAPLSPAPSLAPSAATDDLCARRPDKLTADSDLDSNSSYSAANRLHYDSEASTSTVFSSAAKKKPSSIVDVLIQKCGRKEDSKKKPKDKDEKTPKVIPKSSNATELLATPSLGLVKNGNKGSLSAKKDKLMEDIFYLGAFRKETVTAFRNAFIKNTDGLIGATEEFAPVVLKTRTRTESRVLKQRATMKEVFGDERPASAPPACGNEEIFQEPEEDQPVIEIKKEPKEPEPKEAKPKLKPKKILKEKILRRSSSIRDGLRSTKSLKRNDAKGRLLRLKKRNSLMKSLASKRLKDLSANKIRKEKPENAIEEEDKSKEEGSSVAAVEGTTKRRLKRLFGRRKFSSGFDYIRKKKKIIRREDAPNNKRRRPAAKPSPESVHDIHKEIKAWFINKSIGETHLHRAARLGYTDCVAYCLEKMAADPSAKDNAGFTPLHFACSKGHVRIARLLLQYGANVSAAAQGGIRPLHEACENSHIEVIRLLLAYGADPLLGTYAGQTPEELTEGSAALLLRLHIADVQGLGAEPWKFPPLGDIIDRDELGCDPLSSPPPASPPPPPDAMVEIQCTDAPLPPFYSLRAANGQPADGLWCLLQDVTNLLQIKSKESLLKQIHCGSGSPKELLREIKTQEFLERAQCHQLLGAGEKVNVRASKVSLVRVTDKLRQLLKIETVLVS